MEQVDVLDAAAVGDDLISSTSLPAAQARNGQQTAGSICAHAPGTASGGCGDPGLPRWCCFRACADPPSAAVAEGVPGDTLRRSAVPASALKCPCERRAGAFLCWRYWVSVAGKLTEYQCAIVKRIRVARLHCLTWSEQRTWREGAQQARRWACWAQASLGAEQPQRQHRRPVRERDMLGMSPAATSPGRHTHSRDTSPQPRERPQL